MLIKIFITNTVLFVLIQVLVQTYVTRNYYPRDRYNCFPEWVYVLNGLWILATIILFIVTFIWGVWFQ